MPQNRTTIRFAVAIAASVIAAPAQQEPCLGNSVPLTGPASFGGLAVKYGAETAIDEINEAGGVLGKKLTLISTMTPVRRRAAWTTSAASRFPTNVSRSSAATIPPWA
jgi:ABC-type branched-subunit amino acid transport system substrate-binding protein